MRILLFVVVIMFFFSVAGIAEEDTSYRSEAVMYTFSGPHDKVTEVFEIAPYWLLKYRNVSNGHFAIWVSNEKRKHINLAANCSEHKVGIAQFKHGGRYYLEVTANGNWDIKIIEKELEDDQPTKTHHEYMKEPWEEAYDSPHDN